MNLLITGGTGYIGSHTVVQLLEAGHQVVIVDNYSNSQPKVLDRIKAISGHAVTFYEVDLLDRDSLASVFEAHEFDGVIHFAGLKAVGESVEKPIDYYQNNVAGSLVLFDLMSSYDVKRIVFSSSATVYGLHNQSPLTEDLPLSTTNPYGSTKWMIEEILRDIASSDEDWSIVSLRYFNPVGAHESGLIGESPNGIPNNLMPYVTQVAVGKRPMLQVFGDDYDTHDGTGVRDYIHVVDLAAAHLKAVEYAMTHKGQEAINVGTGVGYSVLDMVKNFESATGAKVPYTITARRPGDIGTCYSDPSKASELLGWSATKNLEDMCRDAWRWQEKNPAGYGDR